MFEYLVGQFVGEWPVEAQQERLNKLGSEGWQLVSVVPDSNGTTLYFRREVKP